MKRALCILLKVRLRGHHSEIILYRGTNGKSFETGLKFVRIFITLMSEALISSANLSANLKVMSSAGC